MIVCIFCIRSISLLVEQEKQRAEFKTPVFLTAKSLKPFISDSLMQNSEPIIFKDVHGQESIGYKAELLPEFCNVFIDAYPEFYFVDEIDEDNDLK